jgi:hypothetical protein
MDWLFLKDVHGQKTAFIVSRYIDEHFGRDNPENSIKNVDQ